MATIQNIQDTILLAQGYYIELLNIDTIRLQGGAHPRHANKLRCIKRLCKALQWDLDIDVNDDTTTSLYELLLNAIFLYNGGAVVFDPSVIIPGRTVVTIPVLIGYNKNTIPFHKPIGVTNFVLSNYSSTYKFLYGNNPDPLSIYTQQGGIEQLDEQTAPIIDRVDPSDVNSNINDITWEYGSDIDVTGYVLIGGFAPAGSGTPSGGGSGSIPFTYSEGNLLQDGNGAWYLPLSLPVGYFVVYASSNGESIGNSLNQNFTPARLYNFTDNSPQIIKVNILK